MQWLKDIQYSVVLCTAGAIMLLIAIIEFLFICMCSTLQSKICPIVFCWAFSAYQRL